jgi:hypothetical protein
MGSAIVVRTDYSSRELRRLAKCVRDAAPARRLLAIAAVLDGALREEAAKIGGMDRQTLRDWVIRFNQQGLDGLIQITVDSARRRAKSASVCQGHRKGRQCHFGQVGSCLGARRSS